MATATVPLTITPEAAARVAELGMQTEFERMLEHARQTVPGLRRMRVTLEQDYEGADEDGIAIWTFMKDRGLEHDRTEAEWGGWKVDTFPPDVCRHFVLLTVLEP